VSEVFHLPENLDAEITVLGAMMLDDICTHEGVTHLREADFKLESHRTIYRHIRDLATANRRVDLIVLSDALKVSKRLESIGGIAYLSFLTEGIPRNPILNEHFEILRRKSSGRRVIEMANAALLMAQDEANNPLDVLTQLSDAATAEMAGRDAKNAITVLEHTGAELERWSQQAKNPNGSMGLSYGNENLDAHTNGMQPGEVTVIGARSGVGKTAALVQAVWANCSRGIGADVFSLEAPAGRLMRHLWAIESGIPYAKVRRPHLCDISEKRCITEAAMRISEWNLRIHDRSDLNVSQIAAYARLGIRQHASALIAVDYAQIIDAAGKDDRIRVSNVSKTLTRLAKDERVSLILLSQLAKVAREFYGKSPTINDLRETGQLENDAHIVMLLHRTFDSESGRLSEESEIIIPKMRDGEPGVIASQFCKKSLRFL